MAKDWDVAIYIGNAVGAAVNMRFAEIKRKWKIDYTFIHSVDISHNAENLPDAVDKCAKTSGTYDFHRLILIAPGLEIAENAKIAWSGE